MLRVDENALICDLAEVYNIYDYRSLPPTRAAAFAVGLRNDSRIKTIMRGDDPYGYGLRDLLVANIHDMFSAFLYGSENASSVASLMLGEKNRHLKSKKTRAAIWFSQALMNLTLRFMEIMEAK